MISDRRWRFSRRSWAVGLWASLAAVTLILAYLGWLDRGRAAGLHGFAAHENAAFMAIRAFGLGETYLEPEKIGHDWRLILARWAGLVVFAGALSAAGVAIFGAQRAAWNAARAKGHTLIVGDHEMARALARVASASRTRVIHVSATAARAHSIGRLITLPRAASDNPVMAGGAARARKVIIAETDLGASVETALRALDQLAAVPGASAQLALHVDDPGTAEQIHHAPGGEHLVAFSEGQAASRAVMLRHPPFLLARRLGASAAHILIVGFGRLGEAIARDFVLNSLTTDLARPWVTVIDPRAAALGTDFAHRHPEFKETCRFQLIADLDDAGLGAGVGGSNDNEGLAPVCAAYVCLHDSAQALAAAFSLRGRATRHGLIQGPIFVRLRSGGLLLPPGGVAGLEPLGLYGFGGLDDTALSSRALDDHPDTAARSIHEAYAAVGGWSAEPWEQLSEESRVSNRRVLTHLPAKLASLGFDLEPWLAAPDDARPWPPPLAPDEPLFRNPGERTAIAVLEHERWMVDRRLNGWRYGTRRDNARKLHPDLVGFDDLSDQTRAFDYRVADWMETYLPRRSGGLTRPTAG